MTGGHSPAPYKKGQAGAGLLRHRGEGWRTDWLPRGSGGEELASTLANLEHVKSPLSPSCFLTCMVLEMTPSLVRTCQVSALPLSHTPAHPHLHSAKGEHICWEGRYLKSETTAQSTEEGRGQPPCCKGPRPHTGVSMTAPAGPSQLQPPVEVFEMSSLSHLWLWPPEALCENHVSP
jgi:hypothetical protein